MSRPRLLVTGFSGFPGARRNPTEALVAGLDVRRLARRFDIELSTAVLPTQYVSAAEIVPQLWRDVRPHAMIHLGLHGRARKVHVESRAKNHMSTVRPDAAGHRPDRPAIDPQGLAVRQATLPVVQIAAALGQRHVPCRLSGDAGSYLCNYVSYLSLQIAPEGAFAGFIHLPWPAEARAQGAPSERPQWALLQIAVEETIRVTAVTARQCR